MSEREPTSEEGARKARRKRILRIVQVVVSLAIVVGIFVGVLPKLADYSSVWKVISGLTVTQIGLLVAATLFNIFTYWPQMTASMPGLTIAQAAVNNQSSTSIANTIPGGGAVAVGVSYAMYRSWGFTNSDIALSTLVTGIWNTFIKLAMPIAAVALLLVTGSHKRSLLIPALIGLVVLASAVVLFALMLWKKAFAERIGAGVGVVLNGLRRLFRKPPKSDWGEAAVRLRKQTIKLVAKRWLQLTVTTIVSHVGLYLVLLMCVRAVGIKSTQVTWAEVLGVFSVVRLSSALPITPGGVGLVETLYSAGLILAGGKSISAQAVAATLIFRALTYGFQIPLGGVTYLIWQRKKSWRKPVRQEVEPTMAMAGTDACAGG